MHMLFGKEESLAERIGRCVQQFPEQKALYVKGRFYTYTEFWEIVKAVYMQIPSGQVLSRIGIYCDDDVLTYAALVAINLYGAAYIPLNHKFPVQRNQRIALESGMEVLLSPMSDPELSEIAGNIPLVIIRNVHSVSLIEKKPVRINIKNTDWYILFTSGSTGLPKGVPVTADNVRSFFNYYLSNYDFGPEDRFLQVYELTFDVSVFSFFMPLLVGACCYSLPDKGIKFMKTAEYLQIHEISVVSMVPGVLSYLRNYFAEIHLPELRYSFFSGDALYYKLAAEWSRCIPNAAIHNFYGPTETTIVCTRYVFDEKAAEKESVNGIVPLGKPFEGMHYIIIDEQLQVAEKGELCFTGTQVTPGYLNGDYEDRFFMYEGRRYYKTGDIASVNAQGNLVFYGRTDDQVKINGYRIELKEVEAAVEKQIGKRCKAMAIKHSEGQAQMIAFVETDKLDTEKLLAALAKLLPGYMLPAEIIAVPAFPLTINGKPDRAKLLELQK